MKAELHAAFVWDCDECGRENFVRAIEGNIDEAALESAENRIVGDLVAPAELVDDELRAEFLVQRISLAPDFVYCQSCGKSFPVEIYTLDDE